jgi:hypothetical protein
VNDAVHDALNHLAVAVATLEAFRDGVRQPTPAQVTAVLQALEEVETLLRGLDAPSS